MSRLPNFLYIGPAKAGSTWIYDVLSRHPEVYMAPGKALHFFTAHPERGLEWYREQFRGASNELAIGEVCHTYLASAEACERIAAANPEMKLVVCLREPVERTFSEYLDRLKNGMTRSSFEDVLERHPELLDRSRYAQQLAPYLERFGRERLHVGVFDQLARDPDAFAAALFAFLGVSPYRLEPAQRKAMMPAGRPRSRVLAALAKRASRAAKALELRRLRGRAKTSRLLRSALYRPLEGAARPRMSTDTRERLRREFQQEVWDLDALLGSDFRRLWGYGERAAGADGGAVRARRVDRRSEASQQGGDGDSGAGLGSPGGASPRAL